MSESPQPTIKSREETHPIPLPVTIPHSIWWLAAVGAVAWAAVGVVGFGVIHANWPIPFNSVCLGVAITTTVSSVILAAEFSTRQAVSAEHTRMLCAVKTEIREMADRVSSLEWEVSNTVSSEVLEANQPTIPLASVVHLNGHR